MPATELGSMIVRAAFCLVHKVSAISGNINVAGDTNFTRKKVVQSYTAAPCAMPYVGLE